VRNATLKRKRPCARLHFYHCDTARCSKSERCRTNVIVAFIVIFNFCVFFVPYDLALALWGVVGERTPSTTCG
jgi:hypothetical protein